MTAPVRSRPRWPRAAVLLATLPFLLATGCSLLADEFTWLDRAGPVVDGPADAAASVAPDRP